MSGPTNDPPFVFKHVSSWLNSPTWRAVKMILSDVVVILLAYSVSAAMAILLTNPMMQPTSEVYLRLLGHIQWIFVITLIIYKILYFWCDELEV